MTNLKGRESVKARPPRTRISQQEWDEIFMLLGQFERGLIDPSLLKHAYIVEASGVSRMSLYSNEKYRKEYAKVKVLTKQRMATNRSYKVEDEGLCYREVTYLKVTEKTSEPLRVEDVIIERKSGHYIDFGRFAYSVRGYNRGRREKGVLKVDLTSLNEDRLPFLRNVLEEVRASTEGSLGVICAHFGMFIDYVDEQDVNVNFREYSSVSTAYNGYIKRLKKRTQSGTTIGQKYAPGMEPLEKNYVSSVKSSLLHLVAGGLKVPKALLDNDCPTKIHVTSREVVGRRKKKVKTKGAVKSNAQALENFIHVVHAFIIKAAPLPLRFEFDGTVRYSHGVEHMMNLNRDFKNHLATFSSIMTPEEIEQYGYIFVRAARNTPAIEKGWEIYIKNVRGADEGEKFPELIANYAMVAGCHLFVLNSTHNLSVIMDLELDTLKFDPTMKGYRSSGLKARAGAGGKWVYPHVGLRFIPILKLLLEIREWILDGERSEWMWVKRPSTNAKPPFRVKMGDFSVKKQTKKNIAVYYKRSGFRGLFETLYPEADWVTSRSARNTISGMINDYAKGDIDISSTILGHTRAVEAKYYLDKALDDVHEELGGFLNDLYHRTIDNAREQGGIPVTIIDNGAEGFEPNPAGECSSPFDPRLAEGLTDIAPKPDCKRFEHCLFCVHFALHSDEIDIRKLLSIAYLVGIIRDVTSGDIQDYNQNWGVIQHRIEEILGFMIEENKALEEVIDRVRNEVYEMERLDDFWNNHLDALIEMGAVL